MASFISPDPRASHTSVSCSPSIPQVMEEMGNVKSNAIYNPNETRNPPPTNMIEQERDSDLEKYIRGNNDPYKHLPVVDVLITHFPAKYEFRKYFDKRGVVAAKLGPPVSRDSFIRGLSPRRSPGIPSPTPSPKSMTQSNQSQLKKDLPQRSASAVAQPTQTPVQPAEPRPASVWDDLASLSGDSSNASLPLQYVTNPTPTQSAIQPSTSFNPTNPYANLAVNSGAQRQSSPLSQPLSLPLQQNPTMVAQPLGFGNGSQPSFGTTPGVLSRPQPTNLFTPQIQQFNTGATLGAGYNSVNSLQPPFSAPAFSNQTFLSQQTQSFTPQQLQQSGSGMLSATFPGQTQGFQQLTPNATGNPFYAMQQQQQLQQVQQTGYIQPQPQHTFIPTSPANPFNQMIQPANPFAPVQTPSWQNGGFPAQQQQWGQ